MRRGQRNLETTMRFDLHAGFTVKEQDVFDEVLTKAYRRMHRYTCAEASLQALLTLWDLPRESNSWATAGYIAPSAQVKPRAVF